MFVRGARKSLQQKCFMEMTAPSGLNQPLQSLLQSEILSGSNSLWSGGFLLGARRPLSNKPFYWFFTIFVLCRLSRDWNQSNKSRDKAAKRRECQQQCRREFKAKVLLWRTLKCFWVGKQWTLSGKGKLLNFKLILNDFGIDKALLTICKHNDCLLSFVTENFDLP